MPNASNDTAHQSAARISDDFLTGNTGIGLNRIRTRLLDLTNRNRLLNFRHSPASSLRVVDVPISPVFRQLRDAEKLSFAPVPEPHIAGEPLLAKDYANKLGWNTSFDLGNSDEKARLLPVLLYHEQLDSLSRKIASAAKTAIEESGTNMLYLVFGFLEWFESDDSKQPHLAPLVALPVALERTGGKGRTVEAVLEYSGEDVETNLSLVEKMRRDFGLEVPPLEEEDTPETYFEKFGDILKLKKTWTVRRHVTLALLSFGKLLMYRDLDPKTWPADQSIAQHSLVRELFEGSKHAEIELAEEFPIDSPELMRDVPHLIRDADSSQHSALVHALRGQNLVIEGPPGTGKSQTITNLIAAALARGKTVLFVAEKLAALEVVRRRLDDVGLGIFCLEVHSHKTKKGAMLNDLAQRYKLRGTFREPRDLDRHLAIVEEKKRLLTQYASLVNRTIEPFNATVFDILWARDRCGQDIANRLAPLSHVILPIFEQFTRTQFAQAEHFLSIYSRHLLAVLAPCDVLERHPWAWIAKPLRFEEAERIVDLLGDFLSIVLKAKEYCGCLHDVAGITLTHTQQGLERATNMLAPLPQLNGAILESLLTPCQSLTTRQVLIKFVEHLETFRSGFELLPPFTSNASPLLDFQTASELSGAVDFLCQWGLERHFVAETRHLLEATNETAKSLREAESSFRVLMSMLGLKTAVALSNAAFLLETVRIAQTAPFEQLHLRLPAFEHERTRPMLQTAHQEASRLRDAEASLTKEFDLTSNETHTPARLLEYAAVLDKTSWSKRLFSRDYRDAVRSYRHIARGKKAPRQQMSAALRSVAEYKQARAQFDNHTGYREMLGPHFKGVLSPWADLEVILLWYEQVFVALPDHCAQSEPFRELLFTARTERLKAIKANLTSAKMHRDALEQGVSRVKEFMYLVPNQHALLLSGSFDEVLGCLQQLAGGASGALDSINRAEISDDVVVQDIKGILAAAERCRSVMAAFQESDLLKIIGPTYRGVETDIGPLRYTVQFAESVTSGNLPQKTAEWLLCSDYVNRLTDLRRWLGGAQDCAGKLFSIAGELTTLAGAEVWNGFREVTWDTFEALAECSLNNREHLDTWNHFTRVRIQSYEQGLHKLTALAEARMLEPKELSRAFHFAFYNTLTRSVFSNCAELSQVTGLTQEQLQHQFGAADRESIRLYSERVAAIIDQRPLSYGNQSGPVRTWTEMALIKNEINKQKRHIPLRQLIRRSARALVALKPCFMMGPLSVAQYLSPGQLKFDLVVMDEASQLKPEDAIGALARAGQMVIVGDPKQLPPTSFFQRVSIDAEGDEAEESRTAVEEAESILDVASTLFQPVRRLRWHYRSRHQSLIAFSNNEFYQRDLIIFPSAYHDDPSLGVKHHFIPDGIFENSRNPREAAVVAEAVLEHMRQHPGESLGVVTLNFEQRELLEELLDRKLRDDPAAIAFQERMTGGQESLFVKNLENVQGDERDVIFISTTYGPDVRGNQYQRFGPINGPSGHRRLNVLFTRSKKRTVVYSSLDPERIHTTVTSPWGIRALKQYLIFARTGILQQADDREDQPTNDFERSVGTVLKENGFQVVPQVGVAGFFIDLGVKHPARAGAFLLGIECDGASYHSGRSARDRDRLRQDILENLGWKIHRIWSTDWFRNRDNEIKRMVRYIEGLLERDPAYQLQLQKSRRIEVLRQQLVTLREEEIALEFPDTPADKCLLRKDLLDQFIQKGPKTKDEWFRKIPEQMRSNVDSKQVGKYLGRVLKTIAECGI